MNILATAVALSDPDLLARIPVLAAHERTATAELVAHLAALRLRPSLYAAQGYGSLFAYCRQALRLSEDAASNRIHAARACLKFPLILDLLAAGELSLSAVRMLRPHLTLENHERVLAGARNARRADILRLVAELAPRPDVAASIRKLPLPRQPAVGGTTWQPALRAVVGRDHDPGTSTCVPVMTESQPPPAPLACSKKDCVTPRTRTDSAGGGDSPAEVATRGCPAEGGAGRPAAGVMFQAGASHPTAVARTVQGAVQHRPGGIRHPATVADLAAPGDPGRGCGRDLRARAAPLS
jgi:hypothetical protein